MKINLECPFAYHDNQMRVRCNKNGQICAFQFYKSCKGWWVNTPSAAGCLVRKEKK